MVTVAVVAATYLAGKLIYRLRDIVLLMAVAGFLALLLNPMVVFLEKKLALRRGLAVTIVSLLAALAFLALALVFGYPLVNGITHLANRLPSYVASAESGQGWIGHIARKYHILTWVQRNTPKLVSYAQSLSKPALTIGKGAVSLVIELFTIFVLVLLLLLEGSEDAALDAEPDAEAARGCGHPGGRRGEPVRHRVHAGEPADLDHRGGGGVRDADDRRRAVPARCGGCGSPWWTSCP